MNLYLVRHGNAVSEIVDTTRPLSSQGEEEIARVAHYFRKNKIAVDVIYHSGKKRAEQTAQILQKALNVPCPLKVQKGLAPNDSIEEFHKVITQAQKDILVVGHLPFLSRLVSQLVLRNSQQEVVAFKTGTLAVLTRIDEQHWKIVDSISPEKISL